MLAGATAVDDKDLLRAQYLVCRYLTRACREAICELGLDDENDPVLRGRALEILKGVHSEWLETLKIIERQSQRDEARGGGGGQSDDLELPN